MRRNVSLVELWPLSAAESKQLHWPLSVCDFWARWITRWSALQTGRRITQRRKTLLTDSSFLSCSVSFCKNVHQHSQSSRTGRRAYRTHPGQRKVSTCCRGIPTGEYRKPPRPDRQDLSTPHSTTKRHRGVSIASMCDRPEADGCPLRMNEVIVIMKRM